LALYLLFGLPSRSGLRFHVIRIRCQRRSGQPRKHGHQPDESVCGEQAQRRALLPRVGRLGRLSTVSLRYFNVFRPGNSQSRRIRRCFRPSSLLGFQAPTSVAWDGEQSRDVNCIDDVRMPTCGCRRRLNTGHFSPAETWTLFRSEAQVPVDARIDPATRGGIGVRSARLG
jgi:hypothetical protein